MRSRGKLYVVGIGPGSVELLTLKAYKIISEADVIIGHRRYIELVRDVIRGEVIESGMGRELERVRLAFELAKEKVVALISGGDPCIYGIASLVVEYAMANDVDVDYEIIPGVSASSAASSLLGCAISGDHAVISLSDHLTDFGEIEHRLRLALRSCMPVAIYNPSSRRRKANFERAIEIVIEEVGDARVAIVRNAYREGQEVKIVRASEVKAGDVDMSTLLIVSPPHGVGGGNIMLTPRGYSRKYDLGARTAEAKKIVEESRRILEMLVPGSSLRDEIVRRAVMASGDASYRDLLVFTGDPQLGVEAIREGAEIIVDVEMVRAGLRAEATAAINFAGSGSTTRAADGIRKLAKRIEGAVVGIGNAPSAAAALCEIAEDHPPAFVVATPVGFVGAAEAKARVRELPVASITSVGTKGGSNVCAAILNCLIEHARSD